MFGATECQAWNKRICLAAIIRLRLRRAEHVSGPAVQGALTRWPRDLAQRMVETNLGDLAGFSS